MWFCLYWQISNSAGWTLFSGLTTHKTQALVQFTDSSDIWQDPSIKFYSIKSLTEGDDQHTPFNGLGSLWGTAILSSWKLRGLYWEVLSLTGLCSVPFGETHKKSPGKMQGCFMCQIKLFLRSAGILSLKFGKWTRLLSHFEKNHL